MSKRGKAVQVVYASQSGDTNTQAESAFTLDEKALASILLRPGIRDKKAVVLSVAGAFRRGKSFILDFFLRYLMSADTQNWLGDPNEPLNGFPWRGGSERDTTGILLWSEPFLVKTPSGEEVAVLLMDTQGSFDSTSTVKQCATVFALSTMLSSTQVYNIHGNIQEDDLQHLHLFTEYGRLALEAESSEKPFQHLEFLVRDWSFPYEYEFGSEGGKRLLMSRLKISPNHQAEHQNLRRHIRACFSKLGCHLLPHPGLKVATNPSFDGRLIDIDNDFVQQLKLFVPALLAPENLTVKHISGQDVTCREIVEYFKAYMKIYQGDSLPEPRSMLEATAEANNLNALMTCQERYIEAMNKICGPDRPFINPDQLEAAHLQNFAKAIQDFCGIRKMGGEAFSATYLERLKVNLKQLGEEYRLSNQNKNIFQSFRTPAVLVVMVVLFHIITGTSEALGLSYVSNLFLLPFYLALITLVAWLYTNYTGHVPQLAQAIDSSTQFVAEKVLGTAVRHIGRRGVAQLVGAQDPT